MKYQTLSEFNIKFEDLSGTKRWEIPHEEPFPYDKAGKEISRSSKGIMYEIDEM